jgi:hypothetical protein
MKSLRLALASACALGALCALATPALGDDPPITTVPTPTVPEPEPAPAPTPAPPVKKARPPKKSTPAPRPTPSKPTTSRPSTPAPAVVTPAAPVQPRSTPKPKKAVHRPHRKRKVHKKVAPRPLPAPDRPVTPTTGASAGLLPAAPGTKPGSFNIGGLFVILGCALAIMCFGIALVPATVVPWRGVAGFIAHRQFDLTVTGLTLLVAVVAFYFLAGV